MGASPGRVLAVGLTTSHIKKPACYEMLHRALGPVMGVCQQAAEKNILILEKWRKSGENCVMRSFVTFARHQLLLG
jgi:hypothetical protein